MIEPQSSAFGTSVYIKQGANAVALDAAAATLRLARQAVAAGLPFRVALSGGSTPRLLYRLLASEPFSAEMPWDSMQFFLGDERWVPPTHEESNFKLANDELFSKVSVASSNIFPVPTEGITPDEAATQYEATLRQTFDVADGDVPSFDLIFLGMGDDGHTASLFPHTGAVSEQQRVVAAPYVEKLGAHRITLTPPVLTSAANVIFMVAGQGKAAALREVLEGEYNPEKYPSQLLRNAIGRVVWLVDTEAASELKEHYPQT